MSNQPVDDVVRIAKKLGDEHKSDIFLYNGEIKRSTDLDFINLVHEHKKRKRCKLILLTSGGDPDAAYKISRYLQDHYERFECLISGYCKSAGTLIAMGAHELVFSPYGELGPLDVQVFKEDKLSGLHSGLNISEALQALEQRSINTYLTIIGDIVKSSGGVVSFSSASKAASDMIASLYGPIFGQIDPEDVGGRTRSMRIAADYGKRLNVIGRNMKQEAITSLAETYSSHSFVIDNAEAKALFNNVREADGLELELIGALGSCARWPIQASNNEKPLIQSLSDLGEHEEVDAANSNDANATSDDSDGVDREDSAGAIESSSADSRSSKKRNGGGTAETNI